jgi:DNA-binding NarL/FixJ family response regulator
VRSLSLSARETDVLRIVAEGMSNQAIADALKISVRTVEAQPKSHHVETELGVCGRTCAIRGAESSD